MDLFIGAYKIPEDEMKLMTLIKDNYGDENKPKVIYQWKAISEQKEPEQLTNKKLPKIDHVDRLGEYDDFMLHGEERLKNILDNQDKYDVTATNMYHFASYHGMWFALNYFIMMYKNESRSFVKFENEFNSGYEYLFMHVQGTHRPIFRLLVDALKVEDNEQKFLMAVITLRNLLRFREVNVRRHYTKGRYLDFYYYMIDVIRVIINIRYSDKYEWIKDNNLDREFEEIGAVIIKDYFIESEGKLLNNSRLIMEYNKLDTLLMLYDMKNKEVHGLSVENFKVRMRFIKMITDDIIHSGAFIAPLNNEDILVKIKKYIDKYYPEIDWVINRSNYE